MAGESDDDGQDALSEVSSLGEGDYEEQNKDRQIIHHKAAKPLNQDGIASRGANRIEVVTPDICSKENLERWAPRMS